MTYQHTTATNTETAKGGLLMDAAALSEQATVTRFNVGQDRVARDFDYGQTSGALRITQDCLGTLTAFIQVRINLIPTLDEGGAEKHFLRVARNLPAEVIALSALNGGLASVAYNDVDIRTYVKLGTGVAGECWAAGLLETDTKLAKKIERAVRKRHGNLKYRKQAARSIAARAGYREKVWSRADTIKAGSILYGYLLKALPDVFTHVPIDGEYGMLTISDNALAVAEDAVEQCLRRKPVFFPCTEPPKPWTSWNDGGYWDERTRLKASVVRAYHKETIGAIRSAIRDGSMKPHLDALNALQAVAWKVNTRVLEVLKWAYENNVPIEGLPPQTNVALPEKARAWEFMEEDERRLWKYRTSQVKERNRSYVGNRVLFAQDVVTAERLAESPRFWVPMNADWRGRVYGIPHFNFQRDDRVRALFLFADGQPIGVEGLRALKVHVANCGDFNKISKRTLAEREAWTDTNLGIITTCATKPTSPEALEVWTNADKPFLFLAGCMELQAALIVGPGFITRLPVSFDGSCSGLQHLCAMTRATEGSRVNLTASTLPQDVYQEVANLVSVRVRSDLGGPSAVVAATCLAHGVTRKVVKRNVMTYSYSSKKFGMSKQIMEDLMRPLSFDVLSGKLVAHPFGEDEGRAASKYLAGHIYDAIETLVTLPAKAMTMLQKCARALAHEGKPLTWTTPLGMPWSNRYHAPTLRRLSLWLHDTRVRIVIADGNEKAIDKDKASNGVAPNFVHALDAAHLLMVANACVSEDITQIATVHDSFGCLAPGAARFNQIIREQFVELYTKHDVLAEVLASASHDLTLANQQRLPECPVYGPLNLTEVLNANFAFS
jgi:DNA-directed RNA polymerase